MYIAYISNDCTMSILTEVINPLQIMYSVSQGQRLDLSEENLPMDIPHRLLIIKLIGSGWAQNPDERPSFLSEFTLHNEKIFLNRWISVEDGSYNGRLYLKKGSGNDIQEVSVFRLVAYYKVLDVYAVKSSC